jgi:hypothetical protein
MAEFIPEAGIASEKEPTTAKVITTVEEVLSSALADKVEEKEDYDPFGFNLTELLNTGDDYAAWVNFGIGGPA